ncbi:pentatricopeptide repeat-containing protein At5g39680 [Phragmites australis]|uniref:pentatricopeptide repeat-containing protein At5g39680 n=1 Tax=Phragmites australis TaxID=29695 RepID=UPI002D781C21|nr:pentatricopeptide repeat-containing protein At5g39680 [Phragmites australis]XP_062197918.1 pentatricopeptide repeat-containing protein At5g39680 [Phragmites australis]XP_062197919.1 pentatricopeptide repeat-containing protein At5g39680 [Phragmites australis]XP_062197920.1 pentatricopeptide repeat-containing protein At5g39680 [Phragmites australis]XP_062197921.1 pentatricopeptide repeat-containing protein At5g39680 [Phragmites australis]
MPNARSAPAAVAVLRAAAAAADLSKGKAIHARLVRATHFDLVLHNHLIAFYAKCGCLGLARRVFDAMPSRNSVSGNLLMSGYASSGRPRDALQLLRVVDFGLNEYVLSAAVAATAHVQSYDMGRQCHGYAIKAGLAEQPHVCNAVLHMYCRCAHMEDAAKVFETVPDFDAFAFNSMINGFLDRGQLDGSVRIVRNMVREVGQWDHVSYVAVLGHCASMKDLVLGGQAHAQALKRRLELNVYVGSALVDMYGKCDCAHHAHCVFEVLPEKNVVSWTAVMTAYTQNELFEDALQLFLDMEIEGVRPNEFTYAVALNSCAGLAALRNGTALGACAMKTGHWAHLPVGNALMNMYSKSGNIEDAWRTFISMSFCDIVSWNLIITGYAHHGLAREAMEAFHDMLFAAEIPSYVTFVGVLSACAQLGLVDEGFYYLNTMMKEVGVTPGREHYTCIVGLLCRAGRLDEAERFILNNCIDTDVVAWRSLLSSCQVYRNYGLGHRVAEQILQLKPNDVGTYVLLSNMYAKANRWDGVVKVRKLMTERGVRKEPGVSWIQVGSEVHVFTSEDKVHPQMYQITKKLEELIDQIKVIGYVPNFAVVLHDIEDEQKEEHLMYHSEKLALAFGLIHSPRGATIRIMKNLRICDDCHVAIKLISIVTSRRIVIRDAVRFHCIEGGKCSCDDYW